MLIPYTLHLASDSKVAIDKLNAIMQSTNLCPPTVGASTIVTGAGPWGRQSKPNSPDADLWVLAARALRARGPNSITLKKVKSHCTPSQVEQGVIERRDWMFNQCADFNAAQGVSTGPWPSQPVLALLLSKHQRCISITRIIQSTMVEILRQSSEHLKQPPPRASTRAARVPVQVISPPQGAPTHFLRRFSRPVTQSSQQASSAGRWDAVLRSWLMSHAWVHSPDAGMPWPMLMAAFEIDTSTHVTDGNNLGTTGLAIRSSWKSLTAVFKRKLLFLAKAQLHPEDCERFQPRSQSTHAGLSVAWTGFLSCSPMWPVLARDVMEKVTRACIAPRSSLPADWRLQLAQGSLSLPYVHLSTLGGPRWRSAVSRGLPVVASGGLVRARDVLLTCPSGCGNVLALRAFPVREATSWPKLACRSCGATARCAKSCCVVCGRTVPKCTCDHALPREGGTQATLHRFWG